MYSVIPNLGPPPKRDDPSYCDQKFEDVLFITIKKNNIIIICFIVKIGSGVEFVDVVGLRLKTAFS